MSERTNNPERIYLEPAPGSPEGRQWCADDVWPLDGDGPGGVEYVRADLAALRSEAQGEDEYPLHREPLVTEAVALIDEAVSEIAGDCQCYEEDGEVVVCWTCRAMNWSDRAERQEGSSDE